MPRKLLSAWISPLTRDLALSTESGCEGPVGSMAMRVEEKVTVRHHLRGYEFRGVLQDEIGILVQKTRDQLGGLLGFGGTHAVDQHAPGTYMTATLVEQFLFQGEQGPERGLGLPRDSAANRSS